MLEENEIKRKTPLIQDVERNPRKRRKYIVLNNGCNPHIYFDVVIYHFKSIHVPAVLKSAFFFSSLVYMVKCGKVDKYQIFNGTHIRLNTFVKCKKSTKVKGKHIHTYVWRRHCVARYEFIMHVPCIILHFFRLYLKFVYRFLCIFNWFMSR